VTLDGNPNGEVGAMKKQRAVFYQLLSLLVLAIASSNLHRIPLTP
jgi:hypothetical protein